MSLQHLRLLPLVLLAACPTEEPPTPVDSDSDSVVDPDPEVPDLDGTIPEATALPTSTWTTPTELATDAINPAGDNDFYTLELAAGMPYHLWVDTGANLLCDTALRLYPPGSTTPASWTVDAEGNRTRVNGDLFARNDDMIFRMSGSDPGLVFVPPSSGRWILEVVEYHDYAGEDEELHQGGDYCSYGLWVWERASAEVECNDSVEVIAALEAAEDADPDDPPGFPLDATTPATQPLGDSLFLTSQKEFTGWRLPGDDDVWQFRFGDFDTDSTAGADDTDDTDVKPDPIDTDATDRWEQRHRSTRDYAMWQWSLWPTNEGQPQAPHRLELLNRNMEVVASTVAPNPDGNHGFVADPGLLYRVTSGSTWYVRVTDIDPPSAVRSRSPLAPPSGKRYAGGAAGQGDYYVGTSHGYGPGILNCEAAENEANWLEEEHAGASDNDEAIGPQLLRFCAVPGTNVYASYTAGFAKPDGLDFRFQRYDPPEPEAEEPEIRVRCGFPGACPDEDYYVIGATSRAGGPVGGRRLTVQVQSASIGSAAEFEVFAFGDRNFEYPFAWTPTGDPSPEFPLSAPDRVLQTIVPDEITNVTILIQPSTYSDRTGRNAYFMRVVVDEPGAAE